MTSEAFDKIASGWYGFRHHTIFPLELRELAKRWQKGRLLNAGCGHGADFIPFIKLSSCTEANKDAEESFDLYGIDFSLEMLKMAGKYAHKNKFVPSLVLGDMRYLPFATGSFDWVIAIASIHHIKGKNQQLEALNELRRVLKSGGEAFITVWNHWQPRFWFKRKDTLVPWRTRSEVVFRYYHLFSFPELEAMVKKAGFKVIKSSPERSYRLPIKYFSRNICLLVKKED